MSNLIIVESVADKYFVEALINNLNISDTEVGAPICCIDEYDCLGGINNLEKRLVDTRFDKYTKIGVILDADDEGIVSRTKFINDTFDAVCSDLNINNQCTFFTSSELEVEVACYITNINGYGELENVLMAVKSKDSTYADCLDSWRQCLTTKGKSISDKEFNKFWVNNYLRLDTCTSSRHRGNKAKYCSQSEETMKKDIWDFDNNKLEDLKTFLNLFR